MTSTLDRGVIEVRDNRVSVGWQVNEAGLTTRPGGWGGASPWIRHSSVRCDHTDERKWRIISLPAQHGKALHMISFLCDEIGRPVHPERSRRFSTSPSRKSMFPASGYTTCDTRTRRCSSLMASQRKLSKNVWGIPRSRSLSTCTDTSPPSLSSTLRRGSAPSWRLANARLNPCCLGSEWFVCLKSAQRLGAHLKGDGEEPGPAEMWSPERESNP